MRAGLARTEARVVLVALCAMAVVLAHAAPAALHDACMLPERSAPAPGEAVRVSLHDSAVFPGPPVDWRPDLAREFFLVDAAGRLDLKDRVPEGRSPMARVSLRSPGTTVVALVSAPAYTVTPSREFQGRLKAEGHDDILEMRRTMKAAGRPGRERSRHYVKTLLNAGGVPSDVALSGLNLVLEIVPEAQPVEVRPGGRLPVKVLFEGMPYPGGLLCATHSGLAAGTGPYAWCGRLDRDGRASVPNEAPGWQLLRTTRLRALAGDNRADWVSYWAALTFEVPTDRSPR